MNESREHSEAAWRLNHGTLDAALSREISAPRLDGTFDRAVWARIAAEQQAALRSPEDLARRLRRSARFALVNWLAGGLVAICALVAVASATLPSVPLAALSTAALPAALAVGALVALLGLTVVSPLGGLVRRYL